MPHRRDRTGSRAAAGDRQRRDRAGAVPGPGVHPAIQRIGAVQEIRAGAFAHAKLLAAAAAIADLPGPFGPRRRVERAHSAAIYAQAFPLIVSAYVSLRGTTLARASRLVERR